MSDHCASRPTHRLLAPLVVLVPAALAFSGPATYASAPPTSPPDTEPIDASAPVESVPAGYVQLIDDTGLLTIVVPEAWSDVDPVPAEDVNGDPQPWLAASTDIDEFLQSFDASGALFTALAYDPDPLFLIDQQGLPEGCAEFVVEPYDDSEFVGLVQLGTGCGENGEASWTLVVANPADQSFTAMVQLQSATSADAEAIRVALESFSTTVDTSGPPETSGPDTGGPDSSAPASSVPTSPP